MPKKRKKKTKNKLIIKIAKRYGATMYNGRENNAISRYKCRRIRRSMRRGGEIMYFNNSPPCTTCSDLLSIDRGDSATYEQRRRSVARRLIEILSRNLVSTVFPFSSPSSSLSLSTSRTRNFDRFESRARVLFPRKGRRYIASTTTPARAKRIRNGRSVYFFFFL